MTDHMKKYEGLAEFGDLVEYIRDGPNYMRGIPTNSDDIFMATIYFTALMASATQKLLRNPNIIYFIQDYEPIFSPQNSDYIEALESYRVPHFAIYSTPFLEAYFKANKFGTYQGLESTGKLRSYSSMPAIKPFTVEEEKSKDNLRKNGKRRLVMYARPHAPRNAFELSVLALSEAVGQKVLDPKIWEFIGLGATGTDKVCNLGNVIDACLVMAKNVPEPEYKKMLSTADIGISLMISPHPSLPPFDFAAAGIVTVTNSFLTKTIQSFEFISSNIIVVDPSLHGIIDGIKIALSKIDDFEARRQGAKLNWPTAWEDERCYGRNLYSKIKEWMSIDTIAPFSNFQVI